MAQQLTGKAVICHIDQRHLEPGFTRHASSPENKRAARQPCYPNPTIGAASPRLRYEAATLRSSGGMSSLTIQSCQEAISMAQSLREIFSLEDLLCVIS